MASRKFAIIQTNLLRSAKMASVDHAARWAWLCGMMRTSFTGVSEYTLPLWCRDAGLDALAMGEAIDSLIEAGLIEWCPETEMLRLIGFHTAHPPDNASAAQRLCVDFSGDIAITDADQVGMLLRASAEFAVAALTRSTRWKEDSPDRPKLRHSLTEFLKATSLEFETDFLDALSEELDGASKAVQAEFLSMLPVLSLHRQNTVSAPYLDSVDTRRQDKDRYEDRNAEENQYDAFSTTAQEPQSHRQAEPSEMQRSEARPSAALLSSRLVNGN